ncbi:uncharacterized protein MKK02DRAFT_42810 [Dioszegia hungarica]|uniref:Yeast cell wall synthesis Kre9/Knh1-like N-terminal domain-containing protein n=1 Tax=Dioszegia hungarica TaxID=4972 RepID=A0AA38HF29_9TREE|nr:uncharacterized protein MKK02DRAFT_42810 [Dioszegia hungarica]KAI9638419.1 hypothetical protein MKK02DRAFT_42810 [Dioszegia hungarica]
MFALTALIALLSASAARAAVTPTSPESATVVRVGGQMNALWAADTTGTWTDMTVQLMTGDNLQMIPLSTLSTGIDGTKDTSHSWTVPNVSPTSKIYFLQFTRTGDPSSAQWTTRFTIASADGTTTPPTNSTTYTPAQGPVQWGIGAVVGGSGAASMPSSNSTSPSASAAAGVASGGVPVVLSSSTFATVPPPISSSSSSASSTTSSSSSSRSASASVSSANAAASSSKAAAGKLEVGGVMGMVLAMIGAAVVAA